MTKAEIVHALLSEATHPKYKAGLSYTGAFFLAYLSVQFKK